MIELNNDVLFLIFDVLPINDILQLRLVSKRIKSIAESTTNLYKILSSSLFSRFNSLQNQPIGIEYKGYSEIILNENYKFVEAFSYTLHAKTYGLAVKAGVVFTEDRWKSTEWIVGNDIRKIEPPKILEDPLQEMIKKGEYDCEKEINWFYDCEGNGWINENSEVSFKIIFPVDYAGRYWNFKVWFAFFVEDMHGNRYWNNNNGWNFDLEHSQRLYYDAYRGCMGS